MGGFKKALTEEDIKSMTIKYKSVLAMGFSSGYAAKVAGFSTQGFSKLLKTNFELRQIHEKYLINNNLNVQARRLK